MVTLLPGAGTTPGSGDPATTDGSARNVLLAAAVRAESASISGGYWRVRSISKTTLQRQFGQGDNGYTLEHLSVTEQSTTHRGRTWLGRREWVRPETPRRTRDFPDAGRTGGADTRAMLRLLFACFVLALLLPAAASADSIVYTKNNDVWLARPDGSGAQALTRGGGYQSPTQANDGTILAQRGTRFVRLDRAGRTLATLSSVLTDAPVSVNAVGPFDPRISPDGTKLAYWIGMYSSWHDYGNNIEWTRTGPVTVWQDARTGRFLGATHYYEEPSWLPDSSGALLFEETNALTAQVVAAGVGADHNHIKQWFHDSDTKPANEEFWKPIGSGEISPAMDRLAVLRGGTHIGAGGLSQGAGNTIALYGVQMPDLPKIECLLTGATGGEFGSPSWSPDGRSLAWAEGDGVWTGTIARNCAGSPRLTIPGAREPDWGPAGVDAASPPRSTSGLAVRTAATIGRRALARRGLKVRVICPSACRAAATASQRGRVVARATRRLAGKGALTLRPARVRRGRLSVRVRLHPAGAAPATFTRRVLVP